jgi:hypothetical protein
MRRSIPNIIEPENWGLFGGLEEYIREINSRLQTLFVQGTGIVVEDATIQTNVFEDVSAAQDSHQVIVSPSNHISATRVTVGIEGRQWLGQMSDGTLRRLSYNLGSGRAVQQAGDSQEVSSGIVSETRAMGMRHSRES